MLTGGWYCSEIELYDDTVLKQYEKDIDEGKVKRWSEMNSRKESEKARKELCVRIAKIDKMPGIKEKLDELYGRLLYGYYEQIELLNECVYRMNKLHKLQTKKKFNYPKDKNIYLIVCGSAISFMEKEILSEKSPLFGRRTNQIFLKPLGGVSINEIKNDGGKL